MHDFIEYIDKQKKLLFINGENMGDVHKLNLLKSVALYLLNAKVESKVLDIIEIVDEKTGYSEYRIMNDCETEDRSLWIEYQKGNVKISPGDLLIKMK